MRNVLVIGGLKRFVDEKVAPKLAQRGLEVSDHWAMDHRHSSNMDPRAGTEVVMLFTDMCPTANATGQHVSRWCKKNGAKFISTTRKAAIFCADLDTAGFTVTYGPEAAPTHKPIADVPAPTMPPPTVAEGVVLPTWLMQHLKTGEPLDPTPEQEQVLFSLGQERTFTVLVRICPGLASRWTDRNKANRPLSEARVDKLAAAFRRGEYRLTHQGMAFGRNGFLQDGQHRLWAIATAPITVDAFVTFGQEVSAIPVIDDVNRRKVYQNRIIMSTIDGVGEVNSKKLAETAKMISILMTSGTSDGTVVATTYDEIDAIVKMFDGGIAWAAALPARKIFMPATVRAALAFAYKTNEEKIKEFALQVLDGENLQRGMPAHTLRHSLASFSPRSDAGRREQAIKALRAAMGYINNESIPKLYATDEALTFFGKAHGFRLGSRMRRSELSDRLERQADEPAAVVAQIPTLRRNGVDVGPAQSK